jgi:hypothetical protein
MNISMCRIADCPGFEETTRRCIVCGYIAHHLCSNELLFLLGSEADQSICFCSRECYQDMVDGEVDELLDIDESDDESSFENFDDTAIDIAPSSVDDMDLLGPPMKRRKSYNIKTKIKVLDLLSNGLSTYKVSMTLDIPRQTIRGWVDQSAKITSFTGSKLKKHIGKPGKKIDLPGAHELVTLMKDIRREEKPLTCVNLINFLKLNHMDWMQNYISKAKSPKAGYQSLLRRLQRFCHANGFSRQRATKRKQTTEDLENIQHEFVEYFESMFGDLELDQIYNCDETGIYYDMAPHTIWAIRGGSSAISGGQRHSYRMTAVLTIRADGKKLPIQFIIKAKPGGTIDSEELQHYPPEHHYVVQEKAWMCNAVWKQYLDEVLEPIVDGTPSVLLIDNFESHVSDESFSIVQDMGSEICCLPPNSTSHVQPLDVSIMGPFKQHLRDLWLLEVDVATTAQEKRKMMIERAIKAWDKITEEEIRGSFQKAIFQSQLKQKDNATPCTECISPGSIHKN